MYFHISFYDVCCKGLRPQSHLQACLFVALLIRNMTSWLTRRHWQPERLCTVLCPTVLFKIFAAVYCTSNCITLFAKASHDTVSWTTLSIHFISSSSSNMQYNIKTHVPNVFKWSLYLRFCNNNSVCMYVCMRIPVMFPPHLPPHLLSYLPSHTPLVQ